MRNGISLGGAGWQLKGTDPYVPLRDKSMETGKTLQGITGWMDACVPGGVTLALYRAGHIDHPYVGMNSLKCEWVENRWWLYRKAFDKPQLNGERIMLHFGGVDYACMVYLNGQLLGEHEGMYEPFSFDITALYAQAEKFVLDVLILHAPDEMGQIGRTSLTSTQKSRFGYKWDFATRLVNLGIWRDVELVAEDAAVLDDLSVTTDVLAGGVGVVRVTGAVRINTAGGPLAVNIACQREGTACARAQATVENGRFAAEIELTDPQLWYPNGMGAQPLYEVELTLMGDAPLDSRHFSVGIRHVAYLQNEGAPEDALPYTLELNGRRMYIKGVNIPPMDHIYGDIPKDMVEFELRRAAEMNANLVRVWGGGLIESEWFYDCCDKLGLLVWQEFIQSSSGIDNIPSVQPGFLALLEKAARCALVEKRNHTSLVIWSGGNELMDEHRRPASITHPNLAMLASLVRELDPTRLYYPSSPSGPNIHIIAPQGQAHDVHGWWQYQGNPQHYRLYAGADNLLHSEFGCDGMSCRHTVNKIFPSKPSIPLRMHEHDDWRFHGDWWCTFDREMTMFGPVKDLDRYILLSQWMQAEGLRYILEANQRRKWRNSGSIIWQLNEPWPNLSCTSLMDYYGHAKMAYFRAKDVFSAFHVSLDYCRLNWQPGEPFEGILYLSTDSTVPAGNASVCVEALDLNGLCLYREERQVPVASNGISTACPLQFVTPDVSGGVFLLRLTARMGDWVSTNEYCFSNAKEHPYRALATLHGGKLALRALSVEEASATIEVKNIGKSPVLGLFLQDRLDEWNLHFDDLFMTLLAGECRQIQVSWSKRFPFGFDEYVNVPSQSPMLEACGIGLDEACPVLLHSCC